MTSSSQYDRIKAKLLRRGELFEDPDFPASARSIDKNGFVSREIKWLRPKEISRDPKFFVSGKSRMDLHQGEIGDCWFIAGVACLATYNHKLLERVVPTEQSFKDDYAGIFKFNFWQFGAWVEVVVDDRIPTKYGRPMLAHNRTQGETNEFWVALLEKAYAKFYGGYYNIDGGHLNDALVDMTGGVSEKFDLKKDRSDLEPVLYELMARTYSMASMLGCSIPSNRIGETALSNGLYQGHAYSITRISTINVRGRKVQLLRLRNPWGRSEWKGEWGDSSREWRSVPSDTKRELGLVPKEDGEFWMEYGDWIKEFEDLDMCHLFPDAHTKEVADDLEKRNWEVTKHHSEWVRGVSAGGCGNRPYQSLFWTNPQFALTLNKSDDADADGKCTVVVSLMQKPQDMDRDELYISFTVYQLRSRHPILLSSEDYDKKALLLYKQPGLYKNSREATGHFRVEPGTYVIIPATFEPHKEGEFYLRTFTETSAETEVIDEPTVIEPPVDNAGDSMFKLFAKHSGGEKRIDAAELKTLLNELYENEVQEYGFGMDVSRGLLAMMDKDRSGLLDYDEFRTMVKELNVWKGVFRNFDKNRSGDIDTNELAEIFKVIGFTLSRSVLTSIIRRYGGKKRRLIFEDFIQVCTRIMVLYNVFTKNAKKDSDPKRIELSLEDWLATTMLY